VEPAVSIAQVILSLLLVIGLIGASAWTLKYLSTRKGFLNALAQGKQLKLVDRIMLDARTRLVVANWKGREYLILLHSGGAQMLDVEEDKSDEV
jgi:flagellar biogenesis protein FliO